MNQDSHALSVLIELAAKYADGVVIFSNDTGKIMYINSTAEQITGLCGTSSISDLQHLVSTLPIEDQNYVHAHVAQIMEGVHCSEVEFRLPKGTLQLDICASAYTLLSNRFTVVFVKDITKNKTHENYLIEFGSKKNTTLDGVVHFISGALYLMRSLSEEATKSVHAGSGSARVYLGLIDNNINHCLEVVKDLLIEEHDKSPNISVKKSRVNVIDKITYIVDNLKSAYPTRIFTFRHPSREIIADIDEIKVLQIVNNLVFNAIKFSGREMPISIGIVDGNTELSIYVADSGIGIPSALKPYIFERNTVAGRQGLNGEQSFGKGLSICKELARLMKGEMSFESDEGKGSIFYLTIPTNKA